MEAVLALYKIRGSVLLLYFAVSLIASVGLVEFALPAWFGQPLPRPWSEVLLWPVWYLLLWALLARPLSRDGGSLRLLVGSRPDPAATRWAVTTGVALFGFSLALFYAVFLPLSFAAPWLVQVWIIDSQSPLIWTRGYLYPWANLVNLLGLALIGPFVEEVFFRGLLLPGWSRRFGPRWAVIWSSLLFAVLHLHTDIVGAFAFGVVTSIVFLETRTLWLPIVIHVTNNTVAWVLAAADLVFFGERYRTLADLQASWWLGLAGLLGGVPLLIGVLRRMPAPRDIYQPVVERMER